jgi:hypothetical protein
MRRHLCCLASVVLLVAAAAYARPLLVPLAPAGLGGAAVFTEAEALVARAAAAAGLDFVPEPRPLPPQVLLILDTPDGDVARRNGLVYWRGDMLPDQLAPDETGTLVRRKRQADGRWKTTRQRPNVPPTAQSNLVAAVRAASSFTLPSMMIETAYHLGTAGAARATLILWRSAEEGSAPLGGAIALDPAPEPLAEAMKPLAPDFPDRDAWHNEFEAFAH